MEHLPYRLTMKKPVRIVVVDPEELIFEGLKARYADTPELDFVLHVANGLVLIQGPSRSGVDLVLMEVSMPEKDGIDTMRELRKVQPGLKVIAHSNLNGIEYINSMRIEGAMGYVLKGGTKEELLLAIRTVRGGGTYISPAAQESVDRGYVFTEKRMNGEYIGLTEREREVIRLIAREKTNSEIAHALSLSNDTVKTHRKHLMAKLEVRSTAGLVKYAMNRGWG